MTRLLHVAPRSTGSPVGLALVCGLGLGLVACREAKKEAPPPAPPTVVVVPVTKQSVTLSNEAVGTVDGYVNADIRARVRGFLQSQDYKEGATVKKGQLLFTIEPNEYQAAVSSSRAALARAKAAQTNADASYERASGLATKGVVSKQELDNATAAKADSAGQVEAAAAALRQAELNLSYTRITAPNDGVAGLALVRVGNLVGQGDPTLLTTVSQIDPIRVSFPLGEIDYVRHPERFRGLEQRDLAWVKGEFARASDPNSEIAKNGVELVLADGRPYPLKGVVVTANRQVDASTGTITIQALFPNPSGELRPGQYGRVRTKREGDDQPVIAVPEKALVAVQGTYSVGVVGPENKVSLRRLDLGAAVNGFRVVTKGLSEGERIVVEGTQKIADGMAVTPQAGPPLTVPSASPAAPAGSGSAAAGGAASSAVPAGSTTTTSAGAGH